MNQDSVDEPPSKRFKAESNGPTNNSNSEIKTASSINGIAFTGNFTNNRIVPISQSNAIANNSRVLLANSRMAPVQNLLSGVMLQQPTSQVQQTGSVGFLRLQSPVNARNITTIPRTPTPNASHINKQSTVFTLNTTGGVPLRIPLQGQQLRSSMALLQQVGNSSSSAPIVLQQPLLVQQQQHGRPFLVLQQPVTTGKQQNTGVGQSVTALVIPQTSGGARPQSSLNLPQSVQQQLQNQLLLQKNQVTQAKHQQASQPQITVQEVTVVQANTHIPNNQNQTQLQQPSTSGQGQASNPPKSGLAGLDDGKKRFLQNQLFALLHARACKAQQNGIDCPFPICRKMQTTLRHMSSCKMGQKCKESLCSSSMHLLYHFKRCSDDVCGICQPVREKHPKLSLKSPMNSSALNAATPSNDATSDMKKTYEVLGLNQHSAPHFPVQPSVNQTQVLSENQSPVTVSGASNPIPSSTSIEVKKEWHSLVTEDLRAFLVQRLVTSVYRIDSTDALRSKELSSLVEQARKIESELYREANSREDYYQRLAGRMHIIQQDLQNNHKILKALKTEANTNENTNGSATSSAQQQLQSILNKKKEELTSSEQIALTQEVNQTPNGSSSLAQGPEIKLENGIKIEPKDDLEGTQASSKIPSKKKVWGCNELRSYLMPVLEKLYRLDPESLPFRQPVDPKQLNIPDYFNIIKKPMDLSTIKRKLDTGVYADPWEFVDDMWLMFENAWLFNRKSSRVHKCCTKLAEVFEPEIDVVMKSMGFCCGRKYVFYPQVLCCYGKPMCTISVNAGYYSYQNRYVYCEPCFMEIKGDEVELSDDPTQPSMIIQKELFSKTKNNEMEPESFVECTHCGRKQHHICSMYHEPIWPGCFVCNHCVRFSAVRRKENKFTSKNLPQTKLSIYLENRINTFLRDNKSGASPITIRVHSVMEKCVEIKPGMKNRFCSSKAGGIVMSNTLPYTAKAIFAYQEVEGSDVCFFGMHVQEYGSNCPAPNTRRVYIAYLDSVNFFQPKVFRTSVYHEILIGYLDYVKNLGFASAHIWACPPSEGDDYIFHCHPQDMKIPKPKRLADWYKKMLDKAIIERVVIDYKDIIKDALENCMQNVTELPYFEGDFWPNVIETCIAELEREEHQRKAEISGDFDDSDSVHSHLDYEDNGLMEPVHTGLKRNQKGPPSNKKKSASKKSGLSKKNNLKTGQAYPGNDLMSKLFVMMEKHREVFFVVRLKNYHDSFANLPPIHDPDPLIATDMMDGRDNFLMMCREKHYEFSSLRRAKHSSMVMLYELHTQAKESFVYLCNYCRTSIETHYHCSTCDDFDLCVPCYQSRGHVHSMEKIGFDLDEDEGASKVSVASANGGKPGSSASENKKQSVQKCLLYLLHACQCNSNPLQTASGFESATTTCKLPNCGRMKQIIQHSKNCNTRKSGCLTCKQLFALCCCHARDCPNAQCPVPFCKGFRQRLEREKHERAQMMRRRMAAMQGGSGMESFSTSYMQALNQRPVSAARAPVRTPISPAVAPTQPSVSQARPPFQSHSPNIRTAIPNAGPAVQQVKMPVADSAMSHAPEGTVDTTVSLNPELIQQLIKSQQNVGGRNIQDSSQLITILKNNPQLQACIKKKQERNHSNSPVVMGEDGRLVLEIPSSNPTLAASSASSQPRQQQIILACNPNIGQRATPSGNSMTGLMHISSSNRHVMLSQTHSTLNAGPSNMQDSTLPIQDRLSRYVDQL